MPSIFGRSIIVPLTNKSGGGVVLGDVVVVDTTTDESFTTTTSAANTSAIGVAAETIASNATGRVIVGGYASLVNVNASVTRNQFGTTHTVAKQAVASSSRVAGTFCRWLKSSATPSAYIYPVDLAGAALTNPMTTAGDLIVGGASGTPGRLADVATGKVLISGGVGVAPSWGSPLAGVAYVGYNTAGGSYLNMSGWYAKKVTISATTLILNIGANMKGNNGSNATALGGALLTDNAGVPGNVIALAGAPLDSTVASNIIGVLNTTARWVELPLNAYVTAADYWIAVGGTFGSAGTQLAYDGSGTDYSKATNYPGDGSVQAYSSGSNKHSIRALTLA